MTTTAVIMTMSCLNISKNGKLYQIANYFKFFNLFKLGACRPNGTHTWFLEIAFVRDVGMCVCACVCVCVCVCVSSPPRL